ncbi:MAG: D-alanyl-D-alanine carboxypeptidase [Clostridia bacterium]|nr:D-alanyl-D-alanine carboxypeptidase [Clostridia bacterium]
MKYFGIKKWIGVLLVCLLLVSCGEQTVEQSSAPQQSQGEASSFSDISSEAVSVELEVSLPEDISIELFPEESSEISEEEPSPSQTVHPLQAQISAKQGFVYDSLLDITFAKGDMEQRIYPASITKLYTAYVALKYLTPETVITAGGELSLVGAGSTVAYISMGDRLTASMLVQGMLLPSGNDAAYVLAAGAGRAILENPDASPREAVDAFMEAVNLCAEADGLTGTHFSVPDGYHREDHYTTMGDLLTIARLVLADPVITSYTGMLSAKVMYASGETNRWTNTNSLLDPDSVYYRENVIGLKTGHTSQAGYCLLAAEKRGDRIIITGVFGCTSGSKRFEDTVTLLESLT